MRLTCLAIFLVFVLLITGCSTATKQQTSASKKEPERKVFQNKDAILAAVDTLEIESYSRNLTRIDLATLRPILPDDDFINDNYNEALWFADHNLGDHIGHGLSFIYSYVQDGIPIVCLPHEIDHLSLFIKYNDMFMLDKGVNEAKEGYNNWVQQSEQASKLLPGYYRNFDALKQEAKLAIEKVEQKDYQGALPHIAYVSQNQIC